MPDVHTETDPAAPEATAPTPSGPTRRKPRLLFWAALFGASLFFGVAAGTAIRLGTGHAQAPDAPARTRAAEPDAPPEPVPPAVRIDTLIRAGSFEEALGLSRTLPELDSQSRAYREGLCLEGLERWADAAETYRRAEDPAGDVAAWSRAVLGRARCAVAEGDHEAARELLDAVSLRSGHADCRGRRVLGECLHLRARLESLALGRHPPPDPLNQSALAWPDLATPVHRIPECLPTGAPAESPPAPETRSRIAVQRSETPSGEPEVTAHAGRKPILAHLEAVATAAGLKFRIDQDVAARAAAETVAVDVEQAPLGEVVAALAGICGAEGWIGGDALVVGPRSPEPAGRSSAATRALRRASTLAPDHPATPAERVTLANLELEVGKVREATTAYRLFLEHERHAPEALHAAYNLGLLELRQQNLPSAQVRFFEVIDRGAGGPWTRLGWWWVGRTYLDAGETRLARRSFLAALGGPEKRTSSGAALGLCACDLLDGDDPAARAVLERHRVADAEPHAAVGELFEALLRYRVAPSAGRREVLLEAARRADAGRAIGPVGVLLVGSAYRDAGDHDRMVALYESEGELARGPLAARMTFATAERFDALDRRHDARQRYLVVAAIDPKGLGPRAELRVAALAARDGRGAECVRRCRTLLDREGLERGEVLTVLGRGYELVADYRRAAECFAGRVPGE